MSRLKPGDTLGTCRIDAFVAEGGMAMVYRAQQTLMNRTVAVKVLKPALHSNDKALASFLKEGMAGARLTHPSIAQVFYTAEENGAYYMVMEFVEGRDLKSIIRERGPFNVRRALEITRRVVDVLAFSHERGIVHRDIKPGNIMLSSSGDVVLTDFGIASLLSESSTGDESSGTPAYMSPEQFRSERVDGRADLYSLGATFFSLISGHPPFRRAKTTKSLSELVLNSPAPSLRAEVASVPKVVDQMVAKLLQKEPGRRYQTARDVAVVIDDIFAEREILSPTKVKSVLLSRERAMWPWVLAATAALVIGVCVYVSFMLNGSSPRQALASSNPGVAEEDTDPSGVDDLETGIEAFKTALEHGRMTGILDLVGKDSRDSPKLINSLISLLQVMHSLPPKSESSHAILAKTKLEANVVALFGQPESGASIRVSLHWVQSKSGRWRLRPDGSSGLHYKYQQ